MKPTIVTKNLKNSRHGPTQNKAATEVETEGDYRDCDKGHTYRDLKELQDTMYEGMVGRRRAKDKNCKPCS